MCVCVYVCVCVCMYVCTCVMRWFECAREHVPLKVATEAAKLFHIAEANPNAHYA